VSKYKYPFGAIWLSHSSISDFDKCPRLYYLRNIYKEPGSGKKIQVVSPYLTLGITVHDTLEAIRYLPVKERFEKPLTDIFEELWVNAEGKKGGFKTAEQEKEFKDRGKQMVKRVQDRPGPIANLSTIIKEKGEMVASMLLSAEDNLVLCGNVDWVEVLPDGTLHIIDFKTGKKEESESSLQLQIYLLLAQNGNKRPVTKTSYWYLDKDAEPREVPIPDLIGVTEQLIEKGRKIKEARLSKDMEGLVCKSGGCRNCLEYEKVVKGEAESVGYDPIREKMLYMNIA
jgi:RecB family exonuclease